MGEAASIDWASFFQEYLPAARRFASGIAAADRADDLAQEAARAVFERARAGEVTFRSRAHARNYFFRTLYHQAVDTRRRGGKEQSAAVGELAISEEAPWSGLASLEAAREAEGRRRLLQEALAGLGEAEQDALRLRFGEGLGYKEMADRTGKAISTLQARVEAAIKKLRQRIGNRGAEA